MQAAHLRRIGAEGDELVVPPIIITPPLTGCTTLWSVVRPGTFTLDCDRLPGLNVRGLSLEERKIAYMRAVAHFQHHEFACVPALPKGTSHARVVAIVLISPLQFARRLKAIPDSRYAEGRAVAAIQWRDEAIALAAETHAPVYSALNHVPLLSKLSVGV